MRESIPAAEAAGVVRRTSAVSVALTLAFARFRCDSLPLQCVSQAVHSLLAGMTNTVLLFPDHSEEGVTPSEPIVKARVCSDFGLHEDELERQWSELRLLAERAGFVFVLTATYPGRCTPCFPGLSLIRRQYCTRHFR